MYRELFHIYGPISINSFGLMIMLGIITFGWLVYRDPRRPALLPGDSLFDVLFMGTFLGVVGARLLCVISDWSNLDHWTSIFKFWEGGFSVLGAVIGLTLGIPVYLRHRSFPVVATMDLFAIYAPLLQAIAKVGCLFAGCCYGVQTTVAWAITYTDPTSIAPLGIPLHPTQIYTIIILLSIFLFMYFYAQTTFKRPGALLYTYLILSTTERFFLDFLRDDRVFFNEWWRSPLSVYQWTALEIIVGATVVFVFSTYLTAPQPARSHESV